MATRNNRSRSTRTSSRSSRSAPRSRAAADVKVMFVNSNGSGFANFVDVKKGTTIAEFFKSKFANEDAASFSIRVNRETVAADYVLKNEDNVSVTPSKVEGA